MWTESIINNFMEIWVPNIHRKKSYTEAISISIKNYTLINNYNQNNNKPINTIFSCITETDLKYSLWDKLTDFF